IPTTPGQDAWSNGLLVANRQRLDDFLAELGRYRQGWLRCDPAIAGLRISGTFSIDDTDSALRALEASLPVQRLERTRYWVTVIPR
ncbi:iron dicitrate transport regulator FecR, partial [Klebsiella pneumoniae]